MKKLIILLGVVGVSMSSLLVRWSQAPSLTLVVYRMGFASVLLIPWVLLRQREELRHLTRRQLGLCLLSGAFLGFHFFAYFTSLNMTSIASSVVLVDTEVFWVALAMFLLTREKPGRLGGSVFFFAVRERPYRKECFLPVKTKGSRLSLLMGFHIFCKLLQAPLH